MTKGLMNSMMIALSAGLASLALNSQAEAKIVPADYMTCNQAINHYHKYGRIYVFANGNDLVPIYGMPSILDVKSNDCSGRNKWMHSYWVNTTDTDTCVIAAYCG